MKEDSLIIPENYAIHKPKKNLLKIINTKKFNDKILFHINSTFHNIKVIENEIGKFIHYNDTYQAGFINTSYYKGNLPYINYFLLPYFFKKEVSKVLLIGFGTGKIVLDLLKIYTGIKIFDIVDIEENIFNIAERFFDFAPANNMNFYLQDAIVFLRNSKTKYDLIIVDVANNEGIDGRFLCDEYFHLINSHLKKDGIFISNLCSSADINNNKNTLYKDIVKIYNKNFNYIKSYIGNYSDKIYYKSFFDLDERVIDITNLIILSSKSHIKRLKDRSIKQFMELFPNISINEILNDEIL